MGLPRNDVERLAVVLVIVIFSLHRMAVYFSSPSLVTSICGTSLVAERALGADIAQ